MSEQLSQMEETYRELQMCKSKLLQLARHIRNTDQMHPVPWGVYGLSLLEDVQEMYPNEYKNNVRM